MMDRDEYRRGWDWKLNWYKTNGFSVGENLFTTPENENGGLDTSLIEETAESVLKLLQITCELLLGFDQIGAIRPHFASLRQSANIFSGRKELDPTERLQASLVI